MAVLKTNYIPPRKSAKKEAVATLDYNCARPGKNEEEIVRPLLGHDGPLTLEQARRMIEEAPKNTYFWRWMLSPDPNGEENADKNLNLSQVMKQLVKHLEGKLNRPIEFIVAEHENTNTPHA